jgi:hypothetical protein
MGIVAGSKEPQQATPLRLSDGAEEGARTVDQRRAGRVEEFVANYDNPAIADRGRVLPQGIAQRAGRIGAAARGGPGENDHVGICARHVFIGDADSGGGDEFAACDGHEFGDPWRGTDSRIGPGLAVDARFGWMRWRRQVGAP